MTTGITAAWLRVELRRRWRSLAVLALLIAVATGTVLTAVAGARRGATATQRLWDRTAPATAAVLPNDPAFDWSKVRALPEVESLTTFAIAALYVDELPGFSEALVPADGSGMHDLERPVVLAGRLSDPGRADEVVITPRFPKTYGKRVGDTVTLHLMTPTQAEDPNFVAGGRPAGPQVRARIVGMVRSPWYSDEVDSGGHLIASPALFGRYPANFVGAHRTFGFINALARLRHGGADLPAFKDSLARVTGRGDIDVWNIPELLRDQQQGDRFEAACLLAFGLAGLVAAVLLVGQALARCVAAGAADLRVLAALGMRRRQGIVAAVAAPVLAGVLGTALGVAAAVVGSRWLPIGKAALSEPAPGVAADPLVLGVGAGAALAAVCLGAAGAAWLALAGTERAASRRSAVAVAAARAGLPVPVVVGTRFALEPGRGQTAVPVRSALLGAVVGVLGVLAASTFSAGVSDAAGTPSRFGQTFQLTAFLGESGHDWAAPGPLVSALRGDRDVAGVGDARIAVAQAGNTSISMYTYAPVGGGALPVVLRSGRLPTGAGEVALAPASARSAHAPLGSTVDLRGARAVTATVVGIAFMPEGGHNTYSDGGWLAPAGYDRLFDGFKYHRALVALRPGADPNAVLGRLRSAGGGAALPVEVTPPPAQVTVIRDVRRLPAALGVFLGVLAVGAVGHALATAVRRRRVEVAVLQALGMTRWQSRGVVGTQASVLAVAGLAFGVPLGLALGRALWRVVADLTPLQYVPPAAVWALALVGPLALAAANLLATWPGRQAARLRIGDVLRAE
jgi:FtsX-like permease family